MLIVVDVTSFTWDPIYMDVMAVGSNSPLYLHVLAHTEPQGMERLSIPERCTPQN